MQLRTTVQDFLRRDGDNAIMHEVAEYLAWRDDSEGDTRNYYRYDVDVDYVRHGYYDDLDE